MYSSNNEEVDYSEDSCDNTRLKQEFEVKEYLGRGAYGAVLKAKCLIDKNEYAIKIIKFGTHAVAAEKFLREAEALAQLNHNNIVRYYNSWIDSATVAEAASAESSYRQHRTLMAKILDQYNVFTESAKRSQATESEITNHEDRNVGCLKYLHIQMELCVKSLDVSIMEEKLYLDECRLSRYFREIVEGLDYVHKKRIIHRDLKPDNIFLTDCDTIKIGDFGLSRQLQYSYERTISGDHLPFEDLTEYCGTKMYMAPELLEVINDPRETKFRNNKYDEKVDIYSLGITYFEMCSKTMTVMEKSEIFLQLPLQWTNVKNFKENHKEKKLLITKMLNIDPESRPTCEAILKTIPSKVSAKDIQDIMDRNKKKSNRQKKDFRNFLRLSGNENVELLADFLKVAVKIFELHGGKNISVPTFLPYSHGNSENFTHLLNEEGNSLIISNSSRTAFCHYAVNNKINNIRRYSTGKVFQKGEFLPNEIHECVFDCISPDANDLVTDAEMLLITNDVIKTVCPQNFNCKLTFYINHGGLVNTILKNLNISTGRAAALKSFLVQADFLQTQNYEKLESRLLCDLEIDKLSANLVTSLAKPINILSAKKILNSMKIIKSKHTRNTAIEQLSRIVNYCKDFGIDSEDIYWAPLLITNKTNCSGIMCQALVQNQAQKAIVATCERFEDELLKCNMTQKNTRKNISAVGISFNVDNIINLLKRHKDVLPYDVLIVAQDKSQAIPLLRIMWGLDLKCDFVSSSDFSTWVFSKVNGVFSHIVTFVNSTDIKVHAIRASTCELIYQGIWNQIKFEYFMRHMGGKHFSITKEHLKL